MSENHYLAEKELCTGRLSDRIDKRHRPVEPCHWRKAQSVRSERVVSRGGMVSRVQFDVDCDAMEPFVENAELLAGLSAEVRFWRTGLVIPVADHDLRSPCSGPPFSSTRGPRVGDCSWHSAGNARQSRYRCPDLGGLRILDLTPTQRYGEAHLCRASW
jgi:hypothetical protein